MKGLYLQVFLIFIGLLNYSLCKDLNDKKYRLVCYWDSTSVYRQGDGYFDAADIDATLCTHLVFRSIHLGADGYLAFGRPDFDQAKLQSFIDLKKDNPETTFMISLDDLSEAGRTYLGYDDFTKFENSLLQRLTDFFAKYSFDGIDVDLSDPDIYGKSPDIKQNIIDLLSDLKAGTDQGGLFLSALVSADKNIIDQAYNVPKISKIVDFVNVKTFDFHGGSEKYTGLNAPMYPRPDEVGDERHLNVDWAVDYWIKQGLPANKLVMGMASFGRSFTLKDEYQHDVGSPVIGYGKAGRYLLKAGILGYNELCETITSDGWTVDFEEHQQTPFAYHSKQWVGYDDVGSMGIKGNYINTEGLGGGMLWSLDTDDFLGNCGSKYPLLTEIGSILSQGGDKPNPNPNPVPDPFEPVCHKEGYFRDPLDCTKFYRCVYDNKGGFTLFNFDCGPGTVFNEKLSFCDFKYNVEGCNL